MKVEMLGHDERYVVEQTLLGLLPEERLEFGPPGPEDRRWARIAMKSGGEDVCLITTEVFWEGKSAAHTWRGTLSGSDYEREGQRRRGMGMCIFKAVRAASGISPAWGSLTGVSPVKLVRRHLRRSGDAARTRSMLTEYYCVAPERARMAVEAAEVSLRAEARLEPRDIAVYVGIPFCPTRCAYCSFVSQSVERSFSLVPPYVDALIQEIQSGGRMVQELGLRVRTFYMGGGTPTTLTADQLDRVFSALEDAFDTAAWDEITVEAGRPDTITPEKLAVLRRHGVGRVSVNPQTMEDSVLRAIGRCHTAGDIARAMEQVAAAGFRHVNMDLIAGLPEDTPEGFRRSLDACLSFGTDNVTVHTLALKKGSAILNRGLRIPEPEAVGQMLDYAGPALRTAGLAPYYLYRQKYMSGSFENVGWCRPGAECWYNVDIMSELCSILSFGAGGSTKMVEPGTNHIQRAFNLKYPLEYIQRPEKRQQNQKEFSGFYHKLKGASN